MKTTIFIHTNNKQGIGLLLSEFSIKEQTKHRDDVEVRAINVDELPQFEQFVGKTYLRKGREITYTLDDLQSFTLSRFMPPELMNYSGRAIVIDPDIFAVQNIDELLDMDLGDKAIVCCGKKDAFDTSMMLMDCAKLKHWSIEKLLTDLTDKQLDYADVMTLKTEDPDTIKVVERKYNSLDVLASDTQLLHTTNRLTQPWKQGLPIDFTMNPMGSYFGIIKKEWIAKLRGTYPTKYQKHPDAGVETWFIDLTKRAYAAGVIDDSYIQSEIDQQHVRADLLELMQ